MELPMAYFVLFLFVAYVAPVFIIKGAEILLTGQTSEQESRSRDSEEASAARIIPR
jgi:hypothetical protein